MTDNPARSQQLTSSGACARGKVASPQQEVADPRVIDELARYASLYSGVGLRGSAAVAAMLLALLVSGCAERRRPTLQWQTASVVHPRIPAQGNRAAPSDAAEPDLEEPAELRLELPEPAPLNAAGRPARPRVATPPPATAEPSKPQTPFVAPQLSAAESSSAQSETNASLTAAEKGIEATRGKPLNAAQTDMASKINGFMSDARAAAAHGDWTSAQTLARKAQLLSEELAKSLQ